MMRCQHENSETDSQQHVPGVLQTAWCAQRQTESADQLLFSINLLCHLTSSRIHTVPLDQLSSCGVGVLRHPGTSHELPPSLIHLRSEFPSHTPPVSTLLHAQPHQPSVDMFTFAAILVLAAAAVAFIAGAVTAASSQLRQRNPAANVDGVQVRTAPFGWHA